MTALVPDVAVLARAEWEPLVRAHAARVDELTAAHLERRAKGERHAIEDFLFEYYSTKVGRLRRWHPGVGVALAEASEHATWRWYRTEDGLTGVDVAAFRAERGA